MLLEISFSRILSPDTKWPTRLETTRSVKALGMICLIISAIGDIVPPQNRTARHCSSASIKEFLASKQMYFNSVELVTILPS